MKRLIYAVLASLVLAFAGQVPAQTVSPAPAIAAPTNLTGNGLVNFFNPALLHNGHKTILVAGNSTVWGATGYFTELCNSIARPTKLTVAGLTPCTSTISGYQVLNGSGGVRVSFTGSAPTGYTVGDLVLSQPTNGALNQLIGTGVVTAIGSTTMDYTLLATNPFPTAGAFVASGGIITNSLANLGMNGATASAIQPVLGPLLQTYARAGDLVLVRGPLINDVRLGACALSCATTRVTALYRTIAAAIPANADIAWKTENSLLTTDPTGSGYVSPLGSSQAYTRILHDAVVQALSGLPPRAVAWDTMQLVYSTLGGEYATSTWMLDILHPASTAQVREAAADTQILTSFAAGRGFPANTMANPFLNANGFNGNPSWISNLQAAVGFSTYKEEHAFTNSYAAPWTLYPDVVLDRERFDPVIYGTVAGFGTNFVRITQPTVNGGVAAEVQPGDVLWFQGSGAVQIPGVFSQAPFNVGSTVYGYAVSNLGNIVPSTVYAGQPVAIFRPTSYQIADVPYYLDKASYPYRHRLTIPASGTNFLRAQFTDGAASWPNGLTTANVLSLPCGMIPLTGATFTAFSTYMQISLTGSWAACSGQNGWVFGTQSPEVTASVAVVNGVTNLNGATTLTRTSGTDAHTVAGSLTGANVFGHAYEDSTAFTSTTTGAYASYDTLATMSGATAYNHFYGFEARHTFSGSGGLTTMAGYYSGPVVSGVANALRHYSMGDAGGVSAITEQSGLYVPDLTRATSNYGVNLNVTSGTGKYNIYAPGTAQNLLAGVTTLSGGQSWAGTITVPSASQRINLATNTNIVLTGGGTLSGISSLNDAGNTYGPLGLNSSVTVLNSPIRMFVTTVASLPSAATAGAGARAFVTDANATMTAGVGTAVTAGGANKVPVYSDGATWIIGDAANDNLPAGWAERAGWSAFG